MKVTFNRKRKAEIPKLKFDRPFWKTVAAAAAADQVDRIQRQKEPDGGTIKQNAPSTRKRKRKQGKPQLSLVNEKGRYVQDGFASYAPKYHPGGRGITLRVRSAKMRKVAGYLIDRGYIWLGISQALEKSIRALFRADIKKQLKKAGRR